MCRCSELKRLNNLVMFVICMVEICTWSSSRRKQDFLAGGISAHFDQSKVFQIYICKVGSVSFVMVRDASSDAMSASLVFGLA
jgi:hypothetical protein